MRKSTGEAMRTVGAVGSVGFAFVLSIAFGVGLGYWLDNRLGTSPWLFLVGFVLGVAAGVRAVFSVMSMASRRDRP